MSKEITSKFHCLSQTRLNRSRRQKNIFFIFLMHRGETHNMLIIFISSIFFIPSVQSCCCIRKSHKTMMMMMEMKFIFLSGHEISFHKISRDCSLSFLFADFFIKKFLFFGWSFSISLFFCFFASCSEDGTLLWVELRAIVIMVFRIYRKLAA